MDYIKGFFESKIKEQDKKEDIDDVTDVNDVEDAEQEEIKQIPKAQAKPSQKQKPIDSDDPIFKIISLPAVFAMVGSPKSGKTHCMTWLLKNYLKYGAFDFGIIFTGTKFSGQFSFIDNPNLIIAGYDVNVLRKFLRKLRDYRLANNGMPAKAFIIFDDMVGQVPWQTELIENLFTTYRWYGVSIFISTQYIYKVPPTVRTVTSYAFIWAQDNKRCYDAIYESFGMAFDDYYDFKRVLDDAVKMQYRCLFYNQAEREIEKRFAQYLAPARIPDWRFRFGSKKEDNQENILTKAY